MTLGRDDVPPPPADAADWEKAAGEFYRGSLDRIRSIAEKWSATTASLLAVFGTVAVVGGPSQISDVPGQAARTAVVALIFVAGVALAAATICGAIAAQGTPHPTSPWGGEDYRAYVVAESAKARNLLTASRCAGILAVGLVFAAGVVAAASASQAAGKEKPSSQVIVVTRSGDVACGEMHVVNGRLVVGGQTISDITQVLTVGAC